MPDFAANDRYIGPIKVHVAVTAVAAVLNQHVLQTRDTLINGIRKLDPLPIAGTGAGGIAVTVAVSPVTVIGKGRKDHGVVFQTDGRQPSGHVKPLPGVKL